MSVTASAATPAAVVLNIARARLHPFVSLDDLCAAAGVDPAAVAAELTAQRDRAASGRRSRLSVVPDETLTGDASPRRRRAARPAQARRTSRPAGLVVPDGHKWCPRCSHVRAVAEFGANRSQPDGLQGYCRACMAEAARSSRNRAG